jgi:uncharacterized protein (DUF1501 family)
MKNRRNFLKLSAVTVSALAFPSSIFAEESAFSDYKALVVIYNAGGNDGFNMFIPSGSDELTGYSNYAKSRENIKVINTELALSVSNNQLDLSSGNPYALDDDISASYTKGFYKHTGMDVATNALMPELAHLVNQGKVAVVTNVGNLIEPATKAEFQAKTKVRPPFLFAHNHQTKLAMTGEASLLNYSGWAGRIFDNWIDVNGGDIYGMNIAVGRSEHLFYGDQTKGLTINANGPTSYKQIKRDIYDQLLQTEESDKFRKLYQELQQHSFDMQDTIVGDWKNNAPTFSSTNAYGGTLFSNPTNAQLQQSQPTLADTSIIKQLKGVAKLAYIGKNRGLKRQIFFVHDGGYDTHNNQSVQHARKLRGMSLGIGDFSKALEEMGMSNEVTTFNISDFGRSIGENGDGTDHAWGNNLFVVGGAVTGGLYGTPPDLTLAGDDDISKKGRLIPTTSMSQYYGTIFKWFGVDDALLAKVVPELGNFTVRDLGFMGS